MSGKTQRVEFLTSVSAAEGSYVNGEVVELQGTHIDPWIKAGICRAVGKDKALSRVSPEVRPVAIETPKGFDRDRDDSEEAKRTRATKKQREQKRAELIAKAEADRE